ncbi:FadR/GntR family transcriptional regulator [Aneurinibacillus migulanus]|uniref:GntR family transcriptional regulator, transcriptional repressor for pyruvate dehydrogenase complex n=1 Tax=Aneurinibacillus migulanus TaxID=47500 RepID=A0A1G8LI75_ANEMI|nr:FadR/GntR family transcriptional regulator [Aneurinibacillus migulanus]MCP1354950.1 FadR family transcriptional regulator [Aneurinibacillus migulanus]MED0893216.1 FadR/GntR family transcriptional regulator [Aneurinibacillus migulanus]MED1615479.1 FadR/GntR family transcriptional regulator [Aneurinibacillus migulanus]MED4727540.1 FadR/GntR family transcriptional regulator [Aneurinibacillus migulanus]SDI55452.1 GntR family transcriptional regulator, transcriptional repressor for pyruvate dehy
MSILPEQRKVYQEILLEINRIIKEDGLKPGDKLPSERELSERLQVGRSSVREALRALELLGLITTRRGEGTFIQHYRHNQLINLIGAYILKDYKTRNDLVEMRKILEIDAVRLACKRARDKHFAEMERIILQGEERIREGQVPTEEDYLFHRAICRSSRNSVLHRMWVPLVEYSKSIREGSLAREGRAEEGFKEHRAILEAIRAGDEEEAVRRMAHHLENSILYPF